MMRRIAMIKDQAIGVRACIPTDDTTVLEENRKTIQPYMQASPLLTAVAHPGGARMAEPQRSPPPLRYASGAGHTPFSAAGAASLRNACSGVPAMQHRTSELLAVRTAIPMEQFAVTLHRPYP